MLYLFMTNIMSGRSTWKCGLSVLFMSPPISFNLRLLSFVWILVSNYYKVRFILYTFVNVMSIGQIRWRCFNSSKLPFVCTYEDQWFIFQARQSFLETLPHLTYSIIARVRLKHSCCHEVNPFCPFIVLVI